MPCKGKSIVILIGFLTIFSLVFLSSLFIHSVQAATFGYHSKGGTSTYLAYTNIDYVDFEYVQACKFTITENIHATSIAIYVYNSAPISTAYVKCAIYSDDGTPAYPIATTETLGVAPLFDGWKGFSFGTTPPELSAGTYWLVMWGDAPGDSGTALYCYYDAGSTNQGAYGQLEFGTWPSPMVGETMANRKYSIYCSYTEMNWHTAETWSLTIQSQATGWHTAETWSLKISSVGSWHNAEAWNISIYGTSDFHDVETWSLEVNSTIYWHDVEKWNVSIYAAAWHDVETWSLTLNSTCIWRDVETWSLYATTKLLDWRNVETWSLSTFGFITGFAWPAHTPFGLSVYGTYVDFNETVYFDKWTWNPSYCTYITFYNIKMAMGVGVPEFTVSILNGNVTFTSIDYQHQIGFDLYSTVGTSPTLYLSGIGSIPLYVTIDDAQVAKGNGWSWDGTKITVSYLFNYTGKSSVLLSWGAVPGAWHTSETWTLTPYTGTLPVVEVYTQYYFLSGTHTVNNVTGYNMQTTTGTTLASAQQNLGITNDTVQWGFTAYMVDSKGAHTVLTGSGPVAFISRAQTGEGFQTGVVAVPSMSMNLGFESIQVNMYVRLGIRPWLLTATFTTDRLMKKGLIASNWGFNVYTKVSVDNSSNILASAYWGSSTVKSSVMGLHFVEPLPQEIALWKASTGDIIGGMLYPYMMIAGDLFYGMGMLFVAGVLYLRHKKWEVILVCLLLFGGPAGIGFLIPDAAYRLLYIVVAFVITIILYRVFR